MNDYFTGYWGPEPLPLSAHYAQLKRDLLRGREAALEQSWRRLLAALRQEVDHIDSLGMHLVPTIEYADLQTDPSQTDRLRRDVRRFGMGVVRGVIPAPEAHAMLQDSVRYLSRQTTLRPRSFDLTCCDLFWSPAQLRARAHPNVLHTHRYMMGIWDTHGDRHIAPSVPIAYADRIRVHGARFFATPPKHRPADLAHADPAAAPPHLPPLFPALDVSPQSSSSPSSSSSQRRTAEDGMANPRSAPGRHSDIGTTPSLHTNREGHIVDEWTMAHDTAQGAIARIDNGSTERWDDPLGYGVHGTYEAIFRGAWEEYHPWASALRSSVNPDQYNSYASCGVFRMFQGLVSLSAMEPGMIRAMPSPHLAMAYVLLRPFFEEKSPPPATRHGPEWEAYLDPSNWQLQAEPDSIFHGAIPSHNQRVTERWHPHLELRRSMIPFPTIHPGDYVLWHPDVAHHVCSYDVHQPYDLRILFYVPVVPLSPATALYLARQRKAFLQGRPAPDFDTSWCETAERDTGGGGHDVESSSSGTESHPPPKQSDNWEKLRPPEREIMTVRVHDLYQKESEAGLQSNGLAPFTLDTWWAPNVPISPAEHNVVQLANQLLFPQ